MSNASTNDPKVIQADVVVLGSGGAALAAAVTAACSGLKVIVVERDSRIGGTSAISGGALWIPGSRQALSGGFKDSREDARLYLKHVIGDAFRADLIDAFLSRSPEALAFLEDHTDLKYSVRTLSPDYYPDLPGATDCGRALEVGEFEGRKLGTYFEMLRPPPRGMMGFGGMMVNRTDIYHFLRMTKSVRSFLHMSRLATRFWFDRLSYSRGTRLVIGNAMIAALLKAALDMRVEFLFNTETQSFLTDAEAGVNGIVARQATGQLLQISAAGGVILGTGGLSRRPGVADDRSDTRGDHLSMAAPKSDGSMMLLAQRQLGAQIGGRLQSNFYWAPMSQIVRRDGSPEVFPHIVTDRAKPGIIAVTDRGTRFVNEANSYHSFVEGMREQQRSGVLKFYLIGDQRALNAYGLGLVRPRPGLHGSFVESGYLIKSGSIAGLAERLGIDPICLKTTVEEFNRNARSGVDPVFGKGSNSYNRAMGDATAKNACLAPLEHAPFYAVQIVTGDLGSAKGLVTDASARVLKPDETCIPGLYAVGTDMNSVMGGAYPGPGIVLGTGLTFGYIAARSILDRLALHRQGARQTSK